MNIAVVNDDTASILLLDNGQISRDLTASRLRARGYSVVTANCGEQALALAKAHRLDMVLLDAQMPEMDALQVLKSLRETRSMSLCPSS
ncbi:MAG: response regulator [Gammaproteobacteria bacterium]|nr:response regulator [Gammaproteobacteria bacterium]MBA3732181.1 response regulator [Gammaproteobacteria bacterium]